MSDFDNSGGCFTAWFLFVAACVVAFWVVIVWAIIRIVTALT